MIALLLALMLSTAQARDAGVIREWRKANPCPSTGLRRGACPQYQVDHVEPLKCGGLDDARNLQWVTIEAHKIKTRAEARMCRTKRSE